MYSILLEKEKNIAIFMGYNAWEFFYEIGIDTLDDLEPDYTYQSSGMYDTVTDYTYNVYILPN